MGGVLDCIDEYCIALLGAELYVAVHVLDCL